ncbi:MAG: thiamine pyrophosphate-dependent dehydrogenase E1 component subunit alpha, partial [Oscillospiraceae bacterium]|nr:thiamine pyrophosphate-dependent dehydrogenase E1 component subunit alpha [Oscillospiraceae bacterium]
MPKSIFADPRERRSASEIALAAIPVNRYAGSLADEAGTLSKGDFLRIYRDMAIIREFETMLNEVKTKGEYAGKAYEHPGPAHLSTGQEAAAVGQAFLLTKDDYIFGSHRSHGEILAKGLSAIEKAGEGELYPIMSGYLGGRTLAAVEGAGGGKGGVKALAVDFLIYGALAEIFAKDTGFNRGLGGSMHAFFTPFGIYPNNAIVGGSADIAVGGALFKKVNGKPGVAIANIGDGSMGCGPVWEAMSFASMDQFRTLWEGEYRGGLPLMFCVMNNGYGMGGQTCGETMGYGRVARVGAGVMATGMHAECVDGYDPLAVVDAMRRKLGTLAAKEGPVLLEITTYRTTGHSPSDSSSYRTKEEIEAWAAEDSIASYGARLMEGKVADKAELDALYGECRELVAKAYALATDEAASPRMDAASASAGIEPLMLSNAKAGRMGDGACEALMPKADNPRLAQIAKK